MIVARIAPRPTDGRELIWKRVNDGLSFEQARFSETDSGAEISGIVLIAQEASPLRVDYRVICDALWLTRELHVEQTWRGMRRTLHLVRTVNGGWMKNGVEDSTLNHCSDVDLQVSPSTNTLPIRRLRLLPNQSEDIEVAWVSFPDLTVHAVDQQYRRVSDKVFQYKNLASGFTGALVVDDDGLPVEYANVWRRVADGLTAPQPASFTRALVSKGPSSEIGEAAQVMGWLVGGWSGEVRDFDPDGHARQGNGEWWFSWVLEGRAIQDVWVVPAGEQRRSTRGPEGPNHRYGSTIRWFDQQDGQWKIVWINPVTGAMNTLSGGRDGNRVLLTGRANGRNIRWSFNEIRSESFVWRGESCESERHEWRLDAEFRLRRII